MCRGRTGDEAVCRWTRQVRMWTWRPPSAGLWVLNGHERQKLFVCLPRSGCVVPGAFWFFRSFSMSQGFSSLTRPTLNRSSSNPQFKPGSRATCRSFSPASKMYRWHERASSDAVRPSFKSKPRRRLKQESKKRLKQSSCELDMTRRYQDGSKVPYPSFARHGYPPVWATNV